jgi:CheY-like chemotaxis protein
VNDPLDLLTPEAVAHLRHSLRTPLNHIIGYADVVYRQAKDQGASAEMELMEQVVSSARRIGDMVSEALPASSHVGGSSVPRLRKAMQGYVDRITYAVDRFQQVSPGACETEIERIRNAARQLFDFARDEASGPAGGRAYSMPPAGIAEPQPGPGRIFEMPAAGAATLPETPPEQADPEGGRILVVGDDAGNREILERYLGREGLNAVSEPDGRAGLDRLRRERFDLVLLDVFTPGMDGFQVLAAIKAALELREIPVIVLSAGDDQEHEVRALEMGADDFLAKPFDAAVLRARIGAILRRRKA